MHAEELAAQDEGAELFRKALDAEPTESPYHPSLKNHVDYMKRHRDIIVKFGRFPHRNALLGRTPTSEEIAFLKEGGDTFDPRKH